LQIFFYRVYYLIFYDAKNYSKNKLNIFLRKLKSKVIFSKKKIGGIVI